MTAQPGKKHSPPSCRSRSPRPAASTRRCPLRDGAGARFGRCDLFTVGREAALVALTAGNRENRRAGPGGVQNVRSSDRCRIHLGRLPPSVGVCQPPGIRVSLTSAFAIWTIATAMTAHRRRAKRGRTHRVNYRLEIDGCELSVYFQVRARWPVPTLSCAVRLLGRRGAKRRGEPKWRPVPSGRPQARGRPGGRPSCESSFASLSKSPVDEKYRRGEGTGRCGAAGARPVVASVGVSTVVPGV